MSAGARGRLGFIMVDDTTIPPQSGAADVLGRCESAAQYLAGVVADFDHRTVGEIREALGLATETLEMASATLRDLGRGVEEEPTDPGAEVASDT